jgi:hypothetical protein
MCAFFGQDVKRMQILTGRYPCQRNSRGAFFMAVPQRQQEPLLQLVSLHGWQDVRACERVRFRVLLFSWRPVCFSKTISLRSRLACQATIEADIAEEDEKKKYQKLRILTLFA